MKTIDGRTGELVDDIPQFAAKFEEKWCPTANCPVCLERTNTAYKIWLPSTSLMNGRILAPHWVEGHAGCYPLLGDAAMAHRKMQSEWEWVAHV